MAVTADSPSVPSTGTAPTRTGVNRSVVSLAVVALLLTVVFVALTWGRMARTVDSSVYLSAAENVAHGKGPTSQVTLWWNRTDPAVALEHSGRAALSDFGPGYSIALAPFVRIGFDPLTAARIVNAVGFFFSVLLTGLIAREILGPRHRVAPIVAAVLVSFGASARVASIADITWATVHIGVFSETIYTPLVLLGALCLLRVLAERPLPARGLLIAAALAFGTAACVRYLGLAAIAGAAVGLAIAGGRRFFRRSVILLGLATIPVATWYLVSRLAYGATASKPFAWHTDPTIGPVAQEIAGWLVGHKLPTLAAITLLAVAFGAPFFVRDNPARTSRGVRLLAVLIAAQVIGLIVTVLFLDNIVVLDNRTLAPVRPLVFLLFVVAWAPVARLLARPIALVVAGVFVALNIAQGYTINRDTFRAWGGPETPAPAAPVLEQTARAHPNVAWASSDGELVWNATHAPTVSVPRRIDHEKDEINRDFDDQVERFARAAENRCGVLLAELPPRFWDNGDAASADDFRARTTVEPVTTTPDISVYLIGRHKGC